MIGEVIYNDEDIKMLEEILVILEHDPLRKSRTESAKKLKEFIERMRFQ